MNLRMGSHLFVDVQIPLLWGTRAVLQDPDEQISIIDLAGDRAKLEVLEDKPAKGIPFAPSVEGFIIMDAKGTELYKVSPSAKTITGIALNLLPVTVSRDEIRVGANIFRGNMVSGFGVGISVTENGIGLGSPVPPGLAELRV